MMKVVQWIVLIWTVIGAVYALTDGNLAWDETIFTLIYSALVFGLMVNSLKNEEAKTENIKK